MTKKWVSKKKEGIATFTKTKIDIPPTIEKILKTFDKEMELDAVIQMMDERRVYYKWAFANPERYWEFFFEQLKITFRGSHFFK